MTQDGISLRELEFTRKDGVGFNQRPTLYQLLVFHLAESNKAESAKKEGKEQFKSEKKCTCTECSVYCRPSGTRAITPQDNYVNELRA